jgi:hypothetical protein
MAGEYIIAENHADYWKMLKAFHESQSPEFSEITKEEYESIDHSEREDSDNHINQERLGSETQVADVTFYKYLPNQKIAYRTHIIDVNGIEEVHYYLVSFGETP